VIPEGMLGGSTTTCRSIVPNQLTPFIPLRALPSVNGCLKTYVHGGGRLMLYLGGRNCARSRTAVTTHSRHSREPSSTTVSFCTPKRRMKRYSKTALLRQPAVGSVAQRFIACSASGGIGCNAVQLSTMMGPMTMSNFWHPTPIT
jgi:hypothetical protein